MRKLATLRQIRSIIPIPDADAIECAIVDGWMVVVKKAQFCVGDVVVYIEIDSWVPHAIAPFLSKGKEPRIYQDIPGERLKTVTLRGQISQGLLLSVTVQDSNTLLVNEIPIPWDFTVDLAEHLNIQKYEPPVPANLVGLVRGMFPVFIPKTDQQRIQNLFTSLQDWRNQVLTWEVTEKLDGASMTVYVNDNDSGVCTRNLNLKPDANNTLWRVTNKNSLIEKIRSTGRNLALQGELIGEGIQKNQYGLRGHEFFLFDVYDIDSRRYLTPVQRRELATTLSIKHVPVVNSCFDLSLLTVEDLLTMSEGVSQLKNTMREGLVFKCQEQVLSFKAISNQWLLKNQ